MNRQAPCGCRTGCFALLEGGSWSILQRQRSVHHTICRGKSAGDLKSSPISTSRRPARQADRDLQGSHPAGSRLLRNGLACTSPCWIVTDRVPYRKAAKLGASILREAGRRSTEPLPTESGTDEENRHSNCRLIEKDYIRRTGNPILGWQRECVPAFRR
jgi:hypothetical protein